jgi:glutathionylspermidine synthase
VYGRFDFTFQNGIPKLLEFNADTPTSLFESSVVQWTWLEEKLPHKDQFNSIHEKLIAYWADYAPEMLHFTCLKDNLEDFTTTEYLRDTAIQAGIATKFVYLEDIGWQADERQFVDLEGEPISDIFKLYPYEWLVHDDFGKHLLDDLHDTNWIEPSWKMLLSNKAILPILYQLFPDHPNLLPAYFDAVDLQDYVKKPLLSREGANITVVKNNQYQTHTEGEYGEEGFIYQALCPLPAADGNFALVGSWVIGQVAAGIGIRESNHLITDNTSRFVPHAIVG